MNSDEIKEENEQSNEQENEEYSFLNETVKNPPLDIQKLLLKICGIIGAAVLFGVIAALVFYAVLRQRDSVTPNQVTIPADVQITQAAQAEDGQSSPDHGQDGPDNSKGNNEGQELSDDSVSEQNVIPTPTPTEEELDQNALDSYIRVQNTLRDIADEALRSVVTVTGVTDEDEWFDITGVGKSASSGLIVADNSLSYLILTESDILSHAEEIAVTLPDGTLVPGSFQKRDPVTGICVVSISKEKIPSATERNLQVAVLGNSYNVVQGDSILAVGAPMGAAGAFACGKIVSLTESVEIIDGEYRLMSTDICGEGSKSGVLVNLDGEVVGFIARKYVDADQHMVKAIPISPIKSLIEKLSNNKALSYIGIHGMDISEKAAEIMDIPSGVYVSSIDEDSPARKAGIQPGDIITSVGLGSAVNLRSLHESIMNRTPGEDIDVVIMRQGSAEYAEFDFTVTIGELPEKTAGENEVRKEQSTEETSDQSVDESNAPEEPQ